MPPAPTAEDPDVPGRRAPPGGPVVLFDGVCNVCNGAVDFILRYDDRRRFSFASLQSEAGASLLRSAGVHLDPGALDTLYLVDEDGAHDRSTAALRIAGSLRWPFRALAALLVIPRAIRDAAYDAFARRRTRWFGTRDACRVPTAEERSRFL